MSFVIAKLRLVALVALTLPVCSQPDQAPAGEQPTVAQPARKEQGDDAARHAATRTEGKRAIQRGARWLIERQGADGAWRSTIYGRMRSGVGNTALVVYGLSQSPAAIDSAERAAAERGARFLLGNLAAEGYVRGPDDEADYPTYGTALLLTTISKLSLDVPPETIAKMQAYLKSMQQGPRQGRGPGHPEFGGWNQTGGSEATLGTWDQSSLSATRVVLEALEAGKALNPTTRDAAREYLDQCQNREKTGPNDGGFFFTPDVTDPRNKAGLAEPTRARSYGSATADGLAALVVCGEPEDSPRRRAAVAWLRERFRADTVPGFPPEAEREALAKGIYYYYAAALADALRRAPELGTAERRADLIRTLVARQQADGSWRNESPFMNEDDPLIATSLAIAALGMLCD